MQFGYLAFFFDPRGALDLDYLFSQCNVTTLSEPELVSTILCSVKVIAITIHNCCLFLSRKCHSDLFYLLHLEYYHLNPSLFHFMTLHLAESLKYYLTLFQCANINIIAHYIFFIRSFIFLKH